MKNLKLYFLLDNYDKKNLKILNFYLNQKKIYI